MGLVSNLGQVVRTHVLLSLSSVNLLQVKGW